MIIIQVLMSCYTFEVRQNAGRAMNALYFPFIIYCIAKSNIDWIDVALKTQRSEVFQTEYDRSQVQASIIFSTRSQTIKKDNIAITLLCEERV